jgi:hypothetical protein
VPRHPVTSTLLTRIEYLPGYGGSAIFGSARDVTARCLATMTGGDYSPFTQALCTAGEVGVIHSSTCHNIKYESSMMLTKFHLLKRIYHILPVIPYINVKSVMNVQNRFIKLFQFVQNLNKFPLNWLWINEIFNKIH